MFDFELALILGHIKKIVGDRRYIGKDGHGQTDTNTRTRKTDNYGKDGPLWKRRTVMEKTYTYGKDGHLWKRRALMEIKSRHIRMKSRLHIDDYFAEKPTYFGQVKAYF